MIREAELFVLAEGILVEVLGRVRGDFWRIVIPPMFDAPCVAKPATIRQAARRYARENCRLPEVLAGRTPAEIGDRHDGDLLGPDPHGGLTAASAAACAAVREVGDGAAVVQTESDRLTVSELLWRLDIARCFLAHDIAMQLGSHVCPFTEELARGMWEGTAPAAAYWRSMGVFREPLPMPDDVSWRDRFLLSAGRDPHCLEDRV
jgi:hypothetical protein